MDVPKTSLKDQYVKINDVNDVNERNVKHLDSLYTQTFLNDYFKTRQSSNKHS